MRYLYKQTGVIVESSIALDSTVFTPIAENGKKEALGMPESLTEEKEPARKTASKTVKK